MERDEQRLPSAHVGQTPAWARPRDERGRLASDPRAEEPERPRDGTGMELPGSDRQWVPKVELPRGGGAIRPVGEKVEAQAFNGSASYGIALPVSPGRDGRAPSLSLSYSSGGGNGPFGVGWSLSVPSITRKTDKGLPRYEDAAESDVFVLAGAEDLVPVRDGAGQRVVRARPGFNVYPYRPRVEAGFARIERWVSTTDGSTHWRVMSPSGSTALYGQDEAGRVTDPDDPARVFSWLLQRSEDDLGHITLYEYKAEEASMPALDEVAERNRTPSAGRYLQRVRYGNAQPFVAGGFLFEVIFDYGEYGHEVGDQVFATPSEERAWPARADAFSSFRAGFDVRTRRLCRRVLMFHHLPELHAEPTLVRSTDLTYDDAEHLAKLVSVTQRSYERDLGTGGYVVADLPPLTLSYSEAVLRPVLHELDATSLRDLPRGVDGSEFRLADLHGDGLPGIVSQQGDVLVYKRPRGDGRFAPAVPLSSQPAAKLGQGGQLVDVDADGTLELVTEQGYYARTADGGFGGLRSFARVPNLDRGASDLQRVDLDGNGLPDVLVVRDDGLVWYPNEGREGYGPPRLLPRPTDEQIGPAVVWQSPHEMVAFADMSGDGLSDVVRIGAGGVAYWPNLGYGRFGRRITMGGSPDLCGADGFDPRRVRLGDLDGSGTTDILVLHGRGATAWLNHSGSRLSAPVPLRPFPGTSEVTAVEVVDLFGDGTSGLLWSTEGDWAKPYHLLYLQLLTEKPHLLTEVDNGHGGVVRLSYESSARQALRDREAGQPWVTRLPFPVQVVTRIEHHDQVARRRFAQRYAYHHGCYDGVEREFRGFGFVERWDTEALEDFSGEGQYALPGLEAELHQPPVLTKTWFHTGTYAGHGALSQQHASEYWDGDAQAWRLPDTVLPAGLSDDETLEAARALRGRTLRQEVYALDGSEAEGTPYTVAESTHVVRLEQPKGQGRHAVVFAHDGQTLTFHYERDADDPRIGHALVLDVDAYGNVTRSVSVGYPRRVPEHPEQGVRTVVVSESAVAAVDDEIGLPDVYRASLPVESRSFEAMGLPAVLEDVSGASRPPVQPQALRSALDATVIVPPEQSAAPSAGTVHLRRLSLGRTFYWADDLSGALPLGQCGTRGLVHEVRAAALSDGQVLAAYGTDVDAVLLGEAGYVAEEGMWWARSPHQTLDPARFYQPTAVTDPFGGTTTVLWDGHGLFVTTVTDPVGNVVTAEHDYRVLSPWRMTDPNGNRTAVGFDVRGMVVWTAVMGKDGAGEGDTETDPTTVLDYDPFAWIDRGEPVVAHVQSRETHGDPGTRWLHAYTYSDGFGGVLLEKASAAPGLAPQRDANGELVLDGSGQPVLVATDPRWVGSGRVVLDNKGNPVRQYEPYFSSTEAYESEAELREQGVTPTLHYDPLGRVVWTQWPDGTQSRVEFTPWVERRFDRNDAVLGTTWHTERMALPAGDPQRRAAELAEGHDSTPSVTHLDALGRPFLHVEHDRDALGVDVFAPTRLVLDLLGSVLEVTDARGNTAETREHGMLQQALRVHSEDAGERRVLRDVMGLPLRSWNSRGFTTTVHVDAARRPVRTVVTRPDASSFTATRIVYGEDVPSPEAQNLRGRAFRVYDGAGLQQSDAFDFAGNLVSQSRRLTLAYDTTPQWTALDGLTTLTDLDTAGDPLLEAEVFTTTATFDALGRPTTQTTPDASVVQLGYDDGGTLLTVSAHVRGAATPTDFVTTLEYDAKGQRQRIAYGNGTQTEYEYEPQTFRLSRLHTTAGATTHQDLRYTYDPIGNVMQIRDLAQPVVFTSNAAVSADQRFTYDARYRLIEAAGREHGSQGQPIADDFVPRAAPDDPTGLRAYTERYVYDLVGNLLQMQHLASGGNWTRHYDIAASGNRLLATNAPGDAPSVHSHVYAYNAHGSMTAMPHLAAVDWDHADRMRSADLGGGGTVWFLYDSAGNRVRKVRVNQTGTSTTERVYVGGYEVYRERVGGELRLERQTLHIADDGGRLCMVETKTVEDGDVVSPANTSRYQYGNHLGSVGMELDETGQLISYEEFHPYGTSAYRAANSAVDVSASRYRYTGQERDEETGLGHHGVRYYASWLGRWTAADPIGLGDGINRFAYARGRPTGLVDPTGTVGEPHFDFSDEPTVVEGGQVRTLPRVTTGRGAGRAGATVYEDDAGFSGTTAANVEAFDGRNELLYEAQSGLPDPHPDRPRGEVSPVALGMMNAPWPTAEGTAMRAARAFADGTPIGDILAAEEAISNGDYTALGWSLLGIIPGVSEGRMLTRTGDDVIDTGRAASRRSKRTTTHDPPDTHADAPLDTRYSTDDGPPRTAAEGGPMALPPAKARPAHPRPPAPEHGTFHVDPRGNTLPTPPGGKVTGSPDGRFLQARDAAGNPTGVRVDGPHRPAGHPDPRAQQPHGHVPGVTNPDGTPWLPIK